MKWFCQHDWSKWSELVHPYGPARQQWRKCNKCNLLRWRNLGYAEGVHPEQVNKLFEDKP